MMKLIVLLTSSGALALSACAPAGDRARAAADPVAQQPVPANDSCGAARVADYLNQLPTTEVIANIQQAIGHNRIRTIRPGDAVTMDFREDRLNIEIGDDGRIRLFRCG